MSEEPLVSVLIPSRGTGPYLAEALASVGNQGYTNWELVLVVDGSDVECVRSTVTEFTRRHPHNRVRVVATGVPRGIAVALNQGIAEARGELLARLDDDDACEPERLALQVAEFVRRPDLIALGSAATAVDSSGQEIGLEPRPTGGRLVKEVLRRNPLIHPSVMVRRNPILELGGYPEGIRRAEDYGLWLSVLAVGQLDNLAQPLVRRRLHKGQHSRGRPHPADLTRIVRLQAAAAEHLGVSRFKAALSSAHWLLAQMTGTVRYRLPARRLSGVNRKLLT